MGNSALPLQDSSAIVKLSIWYGEATPMIIFVEVIIYMYVYMKLQRVPSKIVSAPSKHETRNPALLSSANLEQRKEIRMV